MIGTPQSWLALSQVVLLVFVLALLAVNRQQVFLLALNARYGCFPWSPAVVDYKPGMTLCPGQSTRVTVPLTQQEDGSWKGEA
jgi:hypothetical protein